MAAAALEVSRYHAHASRGLAFAVAHLLDGRALPGLHSQPLIEVTLTPRGQSRSLVLRVESIDLWKPELPPCSARAPRCSRPGSVHARPWNCSQQADAPSQS